MLQGHIPDFSLPDIFQLIALTKKSGLLRVLTDAAEGRITFEGGAVSYAVADVARSAIGVELVQAGLVSDDRVVEQLESARADGAQGTLSRAVLEGVDVEPEALEAFLQAWVEDAVAALLALPEATFSFDVAPADEPTCGLSLTTDELVAEADRRAGEWRSVGEHVPSSSAVLVADPSAASDDGQVALTAQQWRLLTLLDGHRTVRDLVELSDLGELAIFRQLADMVAAGLLRVRTADERAALAERDTRRERLRRIAALELGTPLERGVPAAQADATDPTPPMDVPHGPGAPDPSEAEAAAPLPAAASVEADGHQDDEEPIDAPEPPRPLTRDEDVNHGLLLRLIDGVRGA